MRLSRIQMFFIRRCWRKFYRAHPKEAKMIIYIITRIFWLASLVLKEFSVFVGIVEQIIKLLAGIVSLTPTREDDTLIQQVEDLFDRAQGKIYQYCRRIVDFYKSFEKVIQK